MCDLSLGEKMYLKVANHAEDCLDLSRAKLGDEYYYASISQCVVDAIFSISVRYSSTRNTVEKFSHFFGLNLKRSTQEPPQNDEMTITNLLNQYQRYTTEYFAENIYKNRQRTSVKNGVLKSYAVLKYCEVLQKYNVNTFADVPGIIGNDGFEREAKNVKGQGSGISTKYFYMLSGEENYIKPDRMISRFIMKAVGKKYGIEESQELIIEAHDYLKQKYKHLTPRLFDYLIWEYQKGQSK
jgi:hypothetical protein